MRTLSLSHRHDLLCANVSTTVLLVSLLDLGSIILENELRMSFISLGGRLPPISPSPRLYVLRVPYTPFPYPIAPAPLQTQSLPLPLTQSSVFFPTVTANLGPTTDQFRPLFFSVFSFTRL